MPVSSTHPKYDKFVHRWKIVRDVVSSDCKKYIKEVDPKDVKRNLRYRDDAQLTNFTARTKHGLLGAVFAKDVVSKLPSEIEYLNSDATGGDQTLTRLAKEITGEILEVGRYGLLVDYPESVGNLTALEVEQRNLKARFIKYNAESLINWKVSNENGNPKLTLVVLKECISDLGEDRFTWVERSQYRVLRLEKGIYTQYVYNEDEELIAQYVPLDSQGKEWDVIPFIVIGADNNDIDIDDCPLYDLAMLNIGHLRNSADYEESVHLVGQPTLIISTEMSVEDFKTANPDGIRIGARRGQNLGPNGSAVFLQADPNQLADVAMQRKEEQAVMVGARIITPQADRETAKAASMRHSGETSILATIANNVQDALTKACSYVLRFMGDISRESEIDILINDKYFTEDMDPNFIMAQIQLLDKGIIAKQDLRNNLRRYNIIEEKRTDEELDAESEALPIPNNPNNQMNGSE